MERYHPDPRLKLKDAGDTDLSQVNPLSVCLRHPVMLHDVPKKNEYNLWPPAALRLCMLG